MQSPTPDSSKVSIQSRSRENILSQISAWTSNVTQNNSPIPFPKGPSSSITGIHPKAELRFLMRQPCIPDTMVFWTPGAFFWDQGPGLWILWRSSCATRIAVGLCQDLSSIPHLRLSLCKGSHCISLRVQVPKYEVCTPYHTYGSSYRNHGYPP